MTVEVVAPAELARWVQRQASGAERYLFGVAGPPGCGKSTIAARLASDLHAPVVAMDGFHLPNSTLTERGLIDSKGAPETFAAADFVDVVRRLRTPSFAVKAPVFDRLIDEPVADGIVVEPTDPLVIIEGNYLLLDEQPWSSLPALLDRVAFIDVPAETRIERLVRRHVEFGKTPGAASDFVMRSDERNAALVEPGRERADLIIA